MSSEFTYDETDVPVGQRTGGRTKEVNPHEGIVLHLRGLVGTDSDEKRARALTVPFLDEDGEVLETRLDAEGHTLWPTPVNRALRQLREPGDTYTNEAGELEQFTVRTAVQSATAHVAGRTIPAATITFWVYTKVVDGGEVAARIVRTVRGDAQD
jgi:hypothetical protein